MRKTITKQEKTIVYMNKLTRFLTIFSSNLTL